MNKQFVTYEIALKFKELGFDEPCIMYYDNLYGNFLKIGTDDAYWGDYTGFQKWNSMPNSPWKPFKPLVSAPLWQQAFDWFRERYNHSGEVYFYSSADFGKWHFDIEPLKLDGERFTTPVKEGFQTYSLARESCIEKLIEIIENSKKS